MGDITSNDRTSLKESEGLFHV